MKVSKKAWECFIKWLRTKCIATVKDFKKYCECNWLVNMNSERLHAKGNNDECKVHIKANENNLQIVYECKMNMMQ